MKIQISKTAQFLYPTLKQFAGLITKAPNNDLFAENIKKELTLEKLLLIAQLLDAQYKALEHLIGDDSAMYDELEETLGGDQAKYITTLCFYLDLTEEYK